MKIVFSFILCLLVSGCSSSLKVVVRDGDCNPVQGVVIYHGEKGMLLFVPWGPFHTNDEGRIVLRSDAIDISITKEGYKPAFVEKLSADFTEVFLYAESEEYESGLINFKKCREKINSKN